MTAPQNFRTAFNGFNREDVVHYIEYLNARHESEINQLNAELDLLRSRASQAEENAETQQQLEQAREVCQQLQEQLTDREDALRELEARCQSLENQEAPNGELEARCASLERQLRDANAALNQAERELTTLRTASIQNPASELEAYRRAERTERVAKERAEQVYRQANGALADATIKVDEAFSQIGSLADKVSLQLAQLQQAVVNSRQALADASNTLYTIRPGTDI